MNKVFYIAVLVLCGSLCSYAQEIQKKLRTEEDGFKWYLVYDGHSGAQDVKGKDIIPLSKNFDLVGYRADLKLFQVSVIKDDILHGYYGLDGKSLIEPGRYDEVVYMNEEGKTKYVAVKKGGKSGICDQNGKEVIPALYDNVHHSNGNCFKVYQGDYSGICDITGHFIIPLSEQYTLISYEAETGCYAVHKGDNLRGVCKKDGTFLIPLTRNYELCNYEKEGWYMIKKNGYYGVCDLSGKEVVKPDKYKSMLFYEDGKGVYTYDENYNSITLYRLKGKSNIKSSDTEDYAQNTNTTTDSSESSLKELFDLAFNTPDTEAQLKYDRYMEVIKADPYNTYGYKASAFNNIGFLYETLGDLNNAKACYEYALQANPNYGKAKENLKRVKAQRRTQRLTAVGNVLGTVGQVFGTVNGDQTIVTDNAYQSDGGTYGGSSSGGTTSRERTCPSCGGSGKCSTQGWADKYRCHGSGRCQHCNNTGTQSDFGKQRACSTCNGTKKCHYCGGSGICSNCGGSGKK